MYREISRTVSFSRLQAVEHESLVNLLADRAGVPVPNLKAVGNASAEIALIAFEGGGIPLQDIDEDELTDELLIGVWNALGTLHAANISHGQLRAGSVRVVEGRPVLFDLGLGSLAPGPDELAGDIVELLFSLGLLVGSTRAAETAFECLGSDSLVEALPYLQVPAVSAVSRRQTDKPKRIVAELNDAVLRLTGAEKPERVPLRRVSLKSLAMLGLILLVGSALIPLITEVDYAEIWGVLETADWSLILVALVIGHTQYLPQATSTMFAVVAKLPFWPLLILQTASQFISLAIPSSAARVAMNATFLQKFGVSVTAAVAQGAIDGFSGFLVQAAILIIVLLTGDVDLGLQTDTGDVPWLLLLGGVALVLAVLVVVILRVRKLHDRIVPVIGEAWEALTEVLRQPTRAIGLLTSNFVYWNVLGLTLWVLLEAVGAPVSYGGRVVRGGRHQPPRRIHAGAGRGGRRRGNGGCFACNLRCRTVDSIRRNRVLSADHVLPARPSRAIRDAVAGTPWLPLSTHPVASRSALCGCDPFITRIDSDRVDRGPSLFWRFAGGRFVLS